MSRTVRAYPALLTAAAIGIVVHAATGGALDTVVWRLAATAAGLATAAVVRYHHRASWLLVVALVVAGLQVSARGLDDGDATTTHWLVGGWDLVAGLVCSLAFIALIARRNVDLRKRDAVDLVAIGTGIALVAWIVAVNPLTESGAGIVPALAAAAFMPTPFLFVTLTSDLMSSGLWRNRSAQLMVAGSWVVAIAVVGRSLTQPSDVAPVDPTLWTAGLAAGYLLLCAAAAHHSAPEIVEPMRTLGEMRTDSLSRLALMAPAVLTPVVLIAVVAPRSVLDTGVRVTGTIVILGAVGVRLYVSMRDDRAARQELYRLLHSDGLTGLPTRRRFMERVAEQLEHTWRSERHPAIIKLNIDRFKQINDTLGHGDANLVLATVARRIEAAAAEFGGFTARCGGDEFVVLDDATRSADDAMERAMQIRRAIAPIIQVADTTVFVTASIGVVVTPHRTIEAEALMRRADIAAHQAKQSGGDHVVLFDDSMATRIAERATTEQALRGATGRNELHLYYQPIVDVETGEISGFEALVRWERDGTIVSPGVFIPIAEETGMISEIGAWALRTALTDLRRWIDDGIVGPETTMSVNVSPRQIADAGFAEMVAAALEATAVPARLLWLEMTESMMLQEPELAKTTLRATNEMGVRLALDDFGTGYSSLSLLQQFPINRLKIDRTFVQGIADDHNDRSLVRTIIAMASSMGLDTVAEGVETIEQLDELHALGCVKAQGFLISRPVPVQTMRSTMVALEDLATLAVFDPERPRREIDPGSPARTAVDGARAASAPVRN